jgi:hypothetical protein
MRRSIIDWHENKKRMNQKRLLGDAQPEDLAVTEDANRQEDVSPWQIDGETQVHRQQK